MLAHARSGVILLLLAFILVRFAHPYQQSYQFQKLVDQEVTSTRLKGQASEVHRTVLDQGRSMKFRINAEDIQVQRLARGYGISVKYAVPLDLIVYKTFVDFEYTASTAEDWLR